MDEYEEGYDFEKLAREIVSTRLAETGDKAPAVVAEIARTILISALKSTRSKQNPMLSVAGICRGALAGLLVVNGDLAQAAPLILKELAYVSDQVPISPEDLMTWAMKGFADIAVIAGPDATSAIESAIDRSFMGAGTVFAGACGEARLWKKV